MSYDIRLYEHEGDECPLRLSSPHSLTGGTYALGGSIEAWLNITYNYAPFFYEHIDPQKGIRFLYGKTAQESIPILDKAIASLGEEAPSGNYWDATAGNARKSLEDLRSLCLLAPHGIVGGD